jgi:hypothetical protein
MRLTRYACIHNDQPQAWPSWVPAAQRRRLDVINRLACAVVDGMVEGKPAFDPDTALVVANSYGSVDSTLRFMTSMSGFGDGAASPTPFTTSVHNSTAGVLGELLGLHGPTTTISQGGTGGLAALRWAHLILSAGRAPAVLVVVGDKHVDWSRGVVGRLSGSPWRIGDGAAACLLEPGDGPGREVKLGHHSAGLCLDGGGVLARDERLLEKSAEGNPRTRAPDTLGSWWPCCMLAALPWNEPVALQLREVEHGHMLEVWLGPPVAADSGIQ